MTEFIGGVTPNPDQQTGYARLTVDSVNVQDGFGASADLTGTFAAGFEEVPVISPSVSSELGGTEVFVIGIHSVDPGTAGIGSSLVGKIDSLIGIKILETGSYSNVEVPIYPISDTTVVRFKEDSDGVTESQQFPPTGSGLGSPKIQAAIYTEVFFGGELPDSTAESSVIEVNGGLNPDNKPPLVPVKEGEFDYKLTKETATS